MRPGSSRCRSRKSLGFDVKFKRRPAGRLFRSELGDTHRLPITFSSTAAMVTGSSEKAAFARHTSESRVALWRENAKANRKSGTSDVRLLFLNLPVVRI